jgi:hypothetical protein
LIQKILIAGLFAVTACAGTDAVVRDMSHSVDFAAPENCDLAPSNGELACDFVSEEGRNRRILLGFRNIEASAAESDEIASLSAGERTELYRALISSIDARRLAAMPAGYKRTGYRLLPASETPPGFSACSEMRDQAPTPTGDRADRVDLHCWGPGTGATDSVQLLFAFTEYNPPGTPVSASFERDADAVLSTIRVTRR